MSEESQKSAKALLECSDCEFHSWSEVIETFTSIHQSRVTFEIPQATNLLRPMVIKKHFSLLVAGIQELLLKHQQGLTKKCVPQMVALFGELIYLINAWQILSFVKVPKAVADTLHIAEPGVENAFQPMSEQRRQELLDSSKPTEELPVEVEDFEGNVSQGILSHA